ncbi:MAG: insulinase family protein [Bryobacterales bacterium]|nr:insulinase family protein [Bryobacterales bacterium]
MIRLLTTVLIAVLLVQGASNTKIFPYPYKVDDFANGLRLVTVPTEFPNVVALYIVVQTGSRNEVEPGKTGFAHFFEHMMFRGTKEFPPEKYQAVLSATGAASNAFTAPDLTAYHKTFSKPDLEIILRMEADRFQNLDYSPEVFRTEALAVLGEYNKNAADPLRRIRFEVLNDEAFSRHPYQHPVMGFLKDIQDMPNQLAYSKEFFQRYYRPEYTTVLVVGDVEPGATRRLVEKYWGAWKRGSYQSAIPAEPPLDGPKAARIDWPTPTLPIVTVAFRGPAYDDRSKDHAALGLITTIAFSGNSALYRELVLKGQKADALSAFYPNRMDPYLFQVIARIKKVEDVDGVRDQILSTMANLKDALVDKKELERVKQRMRNELALSMDNSEAIARTLAEFIALRRTPETINTLYETYSTLTPEDLRETARKYFQEKNRVVVTLVGGGK